MAGIEGSVNASVSPLSLPASGLTIIGITVIGGVGYATLPIDSSRDAIFLANEGGLSSPAAAAASSVATPPQMHKVNFVVKGKDLKFTLTGAVTSITVYYGKPFADSLPLEAYAGVVGSATAAGNTVVTYNFPGDVKLTGIMCLQTLATGDVFATWNTGSGISVRVDYPISASPEYPATPLNMIDAALAVQVTINLGAAGQAYVVIYYQSSR